MLIKTQHKITIEIVDNKVDRYHAFPEFIFDKIPTYEEFHQILVELDDYETDRLAEYFRDYAIKNKYEKEQIGHYPIAIHPPYWSDIQYYWRIKLVDIRYYE